MKIALQILALVVVAAVLGLAIEWFRRRGLRSWAGSMGGTFEAGGMISGAPLPEGDLFEPSGGDKAPVYNNIVRLRRGERTFVLAQYYRSWTDIRNQVRSVSHPICLVEIPGLGAPAVVVGPSRALSTAVRGAVGMTLPSEPLRIDPAVDGFASRFEARPAGGAPVPPDALRRLLPDDVQRELLERPSLLAGFDAKGDWARVRAVEAVKKDYAALLESAERLASAWIRAR